MEEQSVSTSTCNSGKRARKTTSTVWEHFDKIMVDGKLKASCKKCDKVYAYEHGTSNMHRHLNQEHAHELYEDDLIHAPFNQEHYRELLGVSILQHNYPFSYVEHQGTRNVHKYLNPEVQFISRNTAKADILNIYKMEKKKLKSALESVPGRICFTSDIWTSRVMDGYLSFTAHYVDKEWNLQYRILNLRFMPPPYTGQLLADKVIGLLRDWGIEKKVFTLTLDNATQNNGLVDVVRSHLNATSTLLYGGEYFHVRCGAHVLNLIVQSGLDVIQSCISKIRDNVKYVKGVKGRLMKFADCVNRLSLKCDKKLLHDVPTRWNSTYLMLECALQYKVAFYHLGLVDTQLQDVTEEEWRKIEKICKFLKPFYDMTTLFSGSKYPTANLYFRGVWKIQSLITMELEDPSSILHTAAIVMDKKFKKYWASYSLILSFAVILDPRYKMKFVFQKLYPTNYAERVRYVHDRMHELYIDYYCLSDHPASSSSLPTFGGGHNDEAIDDLNDEFESFTNQHNRNDGTKSQFDFYLEETKLDVKMQLDVLSYWKSKENKYPLLACMARDILSIPITTVASESCFSTGGQVINKYRSSITPDNAEALVCTRNWLWNSEGNVKDEEDEEDVATDLESCIESLDINN